MWVTEKKKLLLSRMYIILAPWIMPHSSFFSGGDFRGQSVVLTVTELMYESLGNVFLRYLLPSLWIRPWSDRARAWSGGGIKLRRAAAARSGLGLGLGLGFSLGLGLWG